MLVLATPRYPRAGGQRHLCGDGSTRFFHKPGQIAPTHVALHHHAALAVFAANLICAFGAVNRCKILQRSRRRNVRGVRITGELGAAIFRVPWQGNEQGI